jgi:2-polyprenyl-6-methoxyphenol hydroxylase-like FAD-dependent oxidoreductase
MRIPTTVEEQLAAARHDPLRVLIAGAGVAGLTLARALRGRGLHPVLIERSDPNADKGYMLALLPLVDPIFRQIGVAAEFHAQSVPLRRYRLHGRHGAIIREYALDALLATPGDSRGIARGELLRVLSTGGMPVTFGATVTSITQEPGGARATLAAGDEIEADFDLIIAAYGLHSTTRELVLRPDQVASFDSGWGGWIGWSDTEPALADIGDETWGAGFFVGLYPVKGQFSVFVGGDRRDTATGPARFVARLRGELHAIDARTDRSLTAIASGEDIYYWKLVDCRCATWSVGRVGLVGDAAAGFLPTAGIGAAMAIESAGQLARRLDGVDRDGVPEALRAFERAQRPRVEAAQDNSRQLAGLVFRRGGMAAAVRDVASRFIPLRVALGTIRTLHDSAPAV